MSTHEPHEVSKIVMGNFDPETSWRDSDLTRLPSVPDKERESIVLCMDELLFPFCEYGDVLYTRCKINPVLHDYLSGLGFSFQTQYRYDLNDEKEPLPEINVFNRCIFKLATANANQFVNYKAKALSPFAITEGTEEYLQVMSLSGVLPDLETAVRVNSKIYSNRLLDSINQKSYGTEVKSAEEMVAIGNTLLMQGPYLLKDPYGVSGKGNLLIDSEAMQQRIARHIHTQEDRGLRSLFLLEPLLAKKTDFSSHWIVQKNGDKELISVQYMMNHLQNYGGSIHADEAFRAKLTSKGYFQVIEKALQVLVEDGYHGYVCFDSMILENGEIVPIVEINARKSMGLINAYLDKHWHPYGLHSWLTYVSVGLPEGFEFEDLLHSMRESKLLLIVPGEYGIVPLSSNSMMVNEIIRRRRVSDGLQVKRGIPKGRLYVSVVARDDQHRHELFERLQHMLVSLSVKVYN